MNEKSVFEKTIIFIKEYRKVIAVMFSIFSVMTLLLTLQNISESQNAKIKALKEWYNQLPEEDWIKQEEDIYDFMEFEIIDLFENLKIRGESIIDLSVAEVGQQNAWGSLIEKSVSVSKEYIKSKYELRDSNGRRVKGKMTVDLNSEEDIFMFYEDKELFLAFSRDDYYNQISSLTNKIVFSYSDNPEIVRIYNGRLYGYKKGKTKIHFFTNGYIFTYSVKVK